MGPQLRQGHWVGPVWYPSLAGTYLDRPGTELASRPPIHVFPPTHPPHLLSSQPTSALHCAPNSQSYRVADIQDISRAATAMDIKTVEIKAFADQKPGTYVIVLSSARPLNPTMSGFPYHLKSRSYADMTPHAIQVRPTQEGHCLPAASLQRVLRHQHSRLHPGRS